MGAALQNQTCQRDMFSADNARWRQAGLEVFTAEPSEVEPAPDVIVAAETEVLVPTPEAVVDGAAEGWLKWLWIAAIVLANIMLLYWAPRWLPWVFSMIESRHQASL